MIIRVILLLAALSLVSGCANNKIKKEAFIKPSKLAVVYSAGHIDRRWSGTQAENQRLLRDTTEIVLKELNKSRHLQLVNQNSVFANSHYKDIKDIPPQKDAFSLTAPGYKGFDRKQEHAKLKALAKDLNANGVLTIFMQFDVVFDMLGRKRPSFGIFVYATDHDGAVIWQDLTHHEGGDFRDFMLLAQVSAREITDNLDKQLRAK